MDISDLLAPECILLDMRVRDKDHLLSELSRRAAPAVACGEDGILRALQAREDLGSTGLGRGFALPHARIGGVASLFGMFARLGRPIEFRAIDERPVDLVFLLLIPPEATREHVGALAAVSRRMRDDAAAQQLRRAPDAATAYRVLTGA